MCANQLGRRNITDEQKTYLLGKLYEARKNTRGNSAERGKDGKYLSNQNDYFGKTESKTAKIIAKEQGVGSATVQRAEHFAKGLDAAEKVSEGFREKVLSGEIAKTIRGAGAAALVPLFVICLICHATRRICVFSFEVVNIPSRTQIAVQGITARFAEFITPCRACRAAPLVRAERN